MTLEETDDLLKRAGYALSHASKFQIKAMIEHEKQKYGWEFIFLGANIDAVETAGRFGTGADRAVDYLADSKGTELNFDAMSETAACFRETGAVPDAPMQAIREDVKKRGRNRK